jgi:hypothetical protein
MIGQGTYASLNRILEEMNMDFKFLSAEVDWTDLLVWIGKFIGLIGAPKLYHEKTTGEHPLTPHITIVENKGTLPLDFVYMLAGGVRDADTHVVYQYATDSFMQSYGKAARTQNETVENLKVRDQVSYIDLKTYSLNNFSIFTSDINPTLELAYKAFMIDENGYPMIPNNERIIEGCKWFIAEKVAFNLWGAGLMLDKVYQMIKTDADFAMASAGTAAITMTPDEMESFTKAWVRLNPILHNHAHSFRFSGVREDLNIGSSGNQITRSGTFERRR